MKAAAYNLEQYPILKDFPQEGCASLDTILPAGECTSLRSWIHAKRPVNSDIFYNTKKEFEQHGRWHNYAPGTRDHNLLLSDELDLRFIEENPAFAKAMQQIAGNGYRIMKKSIIRSVPGWAIPAWILEYVNDVGRPNLNPFVRDEYQDVQYFHATDFHQDKTRPESNFATVYIYLDSVSEDYSALRILKRSHILGMTTYPHLLRKSHHYADKWFYSDTNGNHLACDEITVTGEAGSVFCFHNLTLHGTVLNNSKDPRISLRYLIQPDPASERKDQGLLGEANGRIIGPHMILPNRTDVGSDGRFLRTGSSLLSYYKTSK